MFWLFQRYYTHFSSVSSSCYSASQGSGVYYRFLKSGEATLLWCERTRANNKLPLTSQVMTGTILCHHHVDCSDNQPSHYEYITMHTCSARYHQLLPAVRQQSVMLIIYEDCPSLRLWPGSAAGSSGRPRHVTRGSETPAAGHRYRRSDAYTWSHKWQTNINCSRYRCLYCMDCLEHEYFLNAADVYISNIYNANRNR